MVHCVYTDWLSTSSDTKVINLWKNSGVWHSLYFVAYMCIGAKTVGTGGDWSPKLLGWGTNNVLVPQLLGRSFQKARNVTASSHQNTGFSIWVFTNLPHSGRGRPPPAPNTQLCLWPGAGRKRPGVETQTFVPSTFQPWLRPCIWV